MPKYDHQFLKQYFDKIAPQRLKWKKRNAYYNNYLQQHFTFLIPPGKRVIELGCGTADLLNAVQPSYGVGLDFSPAMLEIAASRFPHLNFINCTAERPELNENTAPFDYVIISDLFHTAFDVQQVLERIKAFTHERTSVIISNYSYLWELPLKALEKMRLKQRTPLANWLSANEIMQMVQAAGFKIVKHERKLLLPISIPFFSYFFNRLIANLPVVNHLNLVNFMIARPVFHDANDYSVSIVIPAKNEKGNIENCIRRMPPFGCSQQFVFIEGHSADDTYDEMIRVKDCYPDKNIVVAKQSGKGKGNAVREGFELATGEVLIILDADLTTPPEEMTKFYDAIKNRHGEFINGCRLVYPMEKKAMRFLNLLANKFFGVLFSYLLGQHVKDTLCGTKVLMRNDYTKIKENRKYFGDFDPFGDFDLLLGASKQNLKIAEVYVRYRDREYGTTQISRFKHGWMLIRMSWFAIRKIKFI